MALGADQFRRLGVHIGDSVVIGAPQDGRRFRVVGKVLVGGLGDTAASAAVVVTPGEGRSLHKPRALHCLVGLNWVVTVHREAIDLLGAFDDRIRGDSELGKLDAHGFLAAILHEHVASYLAELRPIAGTYPRGKDLSEDERLARELIVDPKERAEHVMLIDLGRNDLGRVAEFGSVKVT